MGLKCISHQWDGKQITGKVTFKVCGEGLMVSFLFSLFAAMKSAKLWFWVDQEMAPWQSELSHFLPGRAGPFDAVSRAEYPKLQGIEK